MMGNCIYIYRSAALIAHLFTTLVRDLPSTLKEEPGITSSTVISCTDSKWKCRAASKLTWISKASHKSLGHLGSLNQGDIRGVDKASWTSKNINCKFKAVTYW